MKTEELQNTHKKKKYSTNSRKENMVSILGYRHAEVCTGTGTKGMD